MANKNTDQAVTRREHNIEAKAKRTQLVDAFGGIVTNGGNYTMLIDKADSETTYIGVAQIGTATSTDEWQIKQILKNGLVTSFKWAGGTDSFSNVWDNRAELLYS